MSDEKLWGRYFSMYLKSGRSVDRAAESADLALKYYRERFPKKPVE